MTRTCHRRQFAFAVPVLVALLAMTGGMSCRNTPPVEAGGRTEAPRQDASQQRQAEPLPDPGEPVGIDPETVATTDARRLADEPAAADETGLTAPEPQLVTVSGEIEEMGPFTSRDVEDGKWIRISAISGIEYILIPAKLWVRSKAMHINEGDGIRVQGLVRTERGRRHVVAQSVSVY